jgi:small-conductance mechanosensitive channel
MKLEVSTPALLFPAISLLFLSYTNRFLHLSALIRSLHGAWLEKGDVTLAAQIENLRRRLTLIRTMQLFGAVSLFLCVIAMLCIVGSMQVLAVSSFLAALTLMGLSLGCLIYEVWISGGALRILLNAVAEKDSKLKKS